MTHEFGGVATGRNRPATRGSERRVPGKGMEGKRMEGKGMEGKGMEGKGICCNKLEQLLSRTFQNRRAGHEQS